MTLTENARRKLGRDCFRAALLVGLLRLFDNQADQFGTFDPPALPPGESDLQSVQAADATVTNELRVVHQANVRPEHLSKKEEEK